MAFARRTPNGLATRIMRATLLIGLSIVVAAGVVAVWSTSKLSAQKAQARDIVAIQVIEDRIESRMRTASTVVEKVAQGASASTERELLEAVRTLLDPRGTGVAELYVADSSGKIVAATTDSTTSVGASQPFMAALQGSTMFIDRESMYGSVPDIWVLRTALDPQRRLKVIMARLDPALLGDVVHQTASVVDGGTILVLDNEDVLIAAGEHSSADLDSARWVPAQQGSGSISLLTPDGVALRGNYDQVQGVLGRDWRVVVLGPVTRTLGDTLSAVAPSLAVLIVGGLVALGVAWALGRRIVKPLRELERAAKSAAAGSYVKPIATNDRDDEVARVAEAFNAVALRLNALHDLSQLLASASQLDQVLDGILSAMSHIIGPGASAIYLVDSAGKRLQPVRHRGGALAHLQPVPLGATGWLDHALIQADPQVIIGESAEMGNELPGAGASDEGVLIAPLLAGAEALGLVVVLLGDKPDLSEAEREMVRTFSAQAAVAVQNSRLFEIESESRRTAEALRGVADALVRPSGLEDALQDVEDIVRELFSAARVRIALVDRAALGLAPARPDSDEGTVLGVGLQALATSSSGGPVRVWHGVERVMDDLLDEYDSAELIAVPIALDTDHGAVMEILMPRVGADPGVLETVQAVADEIALALDNAYFYERAVARAANLETIFRISQVVGSSLQINVVLNRVLDVVQKILEADAVALLMYDQRKGMLSTSMARGQVPSSLLHLEIEPGEDLPGRVFDTGEPIVVHDLHAGMIGLAGAVATNELRSLVAVPLLARSRSIGVLMVFSAHAGAFTAEDIGVLQTFAAQAALALDTARLYGREHEVATILQRSIIPGALPSFEEVETGSVYNPAGGEADIGGDYYDIFRSPTGEIWLAIADVCGKGVKAATKTSMIKYSVRALVAAGLGPASVLREVNRMTAEAGDPSDIVTLWAGFYDAEAGAVEWASGGHPPVLLMHTDGTIDALAPTGPLLGAIPSVEYGAQRATFAPGDTLLLYTDGVTEARQGNIFFGEHRVSAALERGGSPDAIARRLLSEVSGFVSGRLRDDVAILVVRANDASSERAKEEA